MGNTLIVPFNEIRVIIEREGLSLSVQSRIHLSRLCLRHRGLQEYKHQQERERASALQ